MTDEERQKLCNDLRWSTVFNGRPAADEIERLAKDVEYWKMIASEDQQLLRDAYMRNVAAAGLIKAAEWHEQRAEEFRIEAEQAGEPSPAPQVVTHLASAYEFRRRVARAIDRSTK
jgi:hypothetical protein